VWLWENLCKLELVCQKADLNVANKSTHERRPWKFKKFSSWSIDFIGRTFVSIIKAVILRYNHKLHLPIIHVCTYYLRMYFCKMWLYFKIDNLLISKLEASFMAERLEYVHRWHYGKSMKSFVMLGYFFRKILSNMYLKIDPRS
jgi:hypothetical protein